MLTLITGITGFAGRHLTALLVAGGADVVGLGRRPAEEADPPAETTKYLECDLADAESVRAAVQEAAPDRIFHLAAEASVARSWESPLTTLENNVRATLNLLEAVRTYAPGARLLVACSGEQYGAVAPDHLPVTEDQALRPQSPYAVSKCAADLLAGLYADAHGVHVVRTRAFNHAGPGQSDTYVVSSFARQIAEAEARGDVGVLEVMTGNADVCRDFTDVRDVVRAYGLALESAPAGEVLNVASGRSVPVLDILAGLAEHTPLDVVQRTDPARVRAHETMEIRGSHEKLMALTGWAPTIPLERTLRDTLDWWRAKLSGVGRVKRALITGITGQDGSHLAELLLDKGYEVHGMVRRSSTETFERIEDVRDRLALHAGDLLDQRSLTDVIRACEPHEIYNLAAMSFVAASWSQPVLTAEFSGVGVTRMLEAVREVRPEARFYQASSSEMFGNVREVPQTESTPFYPRSPYGVAKAYGHFITVNYRESYDLFACSGICFNHEGPRRGREFVTRKVSDGVARIKLGLVDHIALGNLEAERDWGYAKDYVEAMWLMLQQDEPDDYVIATGSAHSVRELVDVAFDHVGLDPAEYVRVDPEYFRPAEVEHLIGDPSKARERLGWQPATSFEELVRLMVDADLELLRRAT